MDSRLCVLVCLHPRSFSFPFSEQQESKVGFSRYVSNLDLRLFQEIQVSLQWLDHFGSIASIVGLLIGLPTIFVTLYQTFKARKEAQQVREGAFHSRDCLEFVTGEGNCINVVPLETLHSLPREGDVILLPGQGVNASGDFLPGAYLVNSIEHIYSPATRKGSRRQEARLTKAVAQVTTLNPTLEDLENGRSVATEHAAD
jgi:hypothetical protein